MTDSINNDIKGVFTVAKDNIKKLSTAELLKQNKALDEKRDFTIEIGETTYKLQHDVIFRKSKQNKLLDDVIKFFQAGAENTELLEMSTPYTALLVIKHFTTLEVSDDISEALSLLDVLVDLEILDKIVDELPEEETTKVFELLTKTVNNMTESLEEAEAEAKGEAEVTQEQGE